SLIHYLFSYLLFQAEDGIRDRNVTGVQTCALPISMAAFTSATAQLYHSLRSSPSLSWRNPLRRRMRWMSLSVKMDPSERMADSRSEERRVGKAERANMRKTKTNITNNKEIANVVW